MKIVNSHYVPLQAPFPIIYCRGEVAMQIGTLIVVEGPGSESGVNSSRNNHINPIGYGIITHSHPVVSYGNKERNRPSNSAQPNDWSEGLVWDNVHLRDITTLCYSDEESIESTRLSMFVSTERLNDMFRGKNNFKLNALNAGLKRLGFPSIFNVSSHFIEGSLKLMKGGLRQNTYSLTSNYIKNLPYFFLAVEWNDLEVMEKNLKEQIDDYISAISPTTVRISFEWSDEEVKPIAERLNSIYNIK